MIWLVCLIKIECRKTSENMCILRCLALFDLALRYYSFVGILRISGVVSSCFTCNRRVLGNKEKRVLFLSAAKAAFLFYVPWLSLTRQRADLQIYAVTPIPDNIDVLQMDRVPDRIKSFYRVNNIRKFRYDRPFHKGPKDKDNEFKVQAGSKLRLSVNKANAVLLAYANIAFQVILIWWPDIISKWLLNLMASDLSIVQFKGKSLECQEKCISKQGWFFDWLDFFSYVFLVPMTELVAKLNC